MGVPTPRSEVHIGDSALAAKVDDRYYILGYFNIPMADTANKISLATELENFKPHRGGWI